jgi:hypothetical protein
VGTGLGLQPSALRWSLVGAGTAGVIGGVAGLVVGLFAYHPTAWFAVFQLAIPSAVLGALVGLVCGAFVLAIGRVAGPGMPRKPDRTARQVSGNDAEQRAQPRPGPPAIPRR